MQIMTLTQGTDQWHAHRASHYNASDAPAMLGCSPYKTRSELVKQYATGIVQDVDPATQRRFDDGHRAEALARPLAEKVIGETLYPVTGVLEDSKLSASFDGLTMLEDTAWEHKALNDTLRAAFDDIDTVAPEHRDRTAGALLPKHYQIQMEQQLLVSGAERVLFMASKWADDGTLLDERHCWYASNQALRQQIIAGWAQFEKDVEAYKANPPAETVKVQAEPVESLPAVAVQLNGTLAVVSNLDKFGSALRTFVERIPAKPATDQEFANAEAACKTLKQAEDALDSAEANALAQISDVEQLRRTVADLKNLARTARLATEKLVKAEKESRKTEIVWNCQNKLDLHYDALNDRLGARWMPPAPVGLFGNAIKGLKSIDSMKDKAAVALAQAIAEADSTANRLLANKATMLGIDGGQWQSLFADFATVGLNDTEAFRAIAEQRIGQHKQAEAQRLEAERERIRQEEADKLRREQERQEIERQKAEAAANNAAMRETLAPVSAAITAPSRPTVFSDVVDAEIDDGSRLKLGQINALLAPISITADGLAQLGFPHVGQDKAARLYRECDVPAIASALIRHLHAVRARASESVFA